jgi:hypothetical protein
MAQGALQDTKGDLEGGLDKVKRGVKSAARKVRGKTR